MGDIITEAGSFYDLIANSDLPAIRRRMHDDFRLVRAEGMPLDTGGTHVGPAAAIRNGWARLGDSFEVKPVLDELIELPSERVLALGRYVGNAVPTGASIDTPFAHVLEFRDGLLSAFLQYTDSAAFVTALEAT